MQSVLFNIYSGSHDVSATGRFVQTLWFWFANRVEMWCFFFSTRTQLFTIKAIVYRLEWIKGWTIARIVEIVKSLSNGKSIDNAKYSCAVNTDRQFIIFAIQLFYPHRIPSPGKISACIFLLCFVVVVFFRIYFWHTENVNIENLFISF